MVAIWDLYTQPQCLLTFHPHLDLHDEIFFSCSQDLLISPITRVFFVCSRVYQDLLITGFRINSALTFPWLCKDMTTGIAHTCVEVRNLTGLYKNGNLHQGISSLMMGSYFFSPCFSSNAIGKLPWSKKRKAAYKPISEHC